LNEEIDHMAHDDSRRKLAYRSPEIIHLGEAVSLTKGSSETGSDFPSTGFARPFPDLDRPGGPETKAKAARKKPTTK
jgi:hypothetical protein